MKSTDVKLIRGKNNIQQFEAIAEINGILSKDLESRVCIARDLLRIELPDILTPILTYRDTGGMICSAVDTTDKILEKIDLHVYTGDATNILRLILKGMIKRIGKDILDNIAYKHMIKTITVKDLDAIVEGDNLNGLLNNICALLR